ncbi:tape measure protein [Phocaeicola vulgatus]|uniref:tape measure protein n=1 Tax=Phocaeicola vulgatus TaxID=821 RepID=UPI000E4CF5D5|nr:tape measure protein [Phocaeicola vulgatus]RHA49238.1 phage tail tape measure protein [Phocaeicola vulgatus]
MSKLYFKIGSDWEEVVRLRNEIAKLKQELMSMDGTQTPAAFKALNAQLAASNQRLDELVTNAAKAGAEMETGFKRKIFDASQVVNGLSEKITFQRGTIQQLKNELSGLKDKYREALKQDGDTSSLEAKIRSTNEKLKEQKSSLFNLTQEQANARLSVKKLRDEYALYRQDGEKNVDVTKQVEQAMSNMGKKLLGGYSIKEFLSSMIRVRGEFQSMQTAIETMVGKDMAGQLIPQIKELAKISPLTMSDMVGAEKMMLGFNIQAEDTIKYLKAISDISMGESSKFNSLTLAFSQMSAAGKLMGQDLNQMINAGFNPLQIISEKTGKSIATLKDEMSKGAVSAEMVQQAFIDATSAGGKFYNMSENASKTINGQLSMMQDALDSVFNELGTKSESVIMDGIQMTTSLIQNYETVGRILAGLVVTYGTYRTAVMLVTAAESKHTLVEIGLTNARLLARKAQLALNAAMLTNPYVLLATAVVGLGVAMWALSDSTTSAERALDSYNKKIEKLDTDEEDRKRTLEGLVSTINSEVEAETTKLKALKDIEELYPALFRKYVDEKGHIQDLTGFWKAYNEEVVKSRTQSKQAIVESLEQQIKSAEWAYNLAKKENNRSEMKVQVQRIEDLKNELANARKDVLSEINAQLEVENRQETKETTYQEDLANAKAEWEKAKKGYEALIKDQTATSKQVKEAKDKMEVSEKTYKELGGVTGSALTRQENLAKKQKENQEKLDGQLLSLHRQNQQDEVSLMKEGTEKKLKQIDLDYQKETDAIKKQRKEWEDAQGGKLTEEQTLVIDLRKELAGKKKDSDTSKVHEEEVKEYQKLLSSYQDYLTKRKNAEDKFNADRKKLKDGGASDAQINELEYQRDETLKSIDNEFAMREDSFKAWTDNIANLSLEKLRELLVQAERELERSEFLNPNDPKLAGQRAKVTSLKNTISEKSEKTNTSPNKRSQKEWQDLYKTLSKVEKEFDEIGKTVGGTAGEIISAAGSIASSTLQMIDGITTLANSSSDAMAGTAQAASKSIQAVEKASVILAIVGAALQITTKMFDLFGSDTTTEKYEEAKEAYQSYINILDKVIDKQLELAESLSGDNAQAAYDRAIELVKTQSEAARVLGKQYLNSGSSWKSHSKGYKEVDDMSAAGWADAAKALGMSVSQFKNAMGGRMTGLFDLTDEQLAKLQEEAHIFWAQLDSDTQNYANQIAEGVAQVKEVLEQQMTDTTLIDVDTLRNDFHDLLTDMDADSADFADNFEDYMRNAILNSMLKESYMGRLEEWRKKFYAAMDDGVTEQEYNALKEEGQQIADEMKAQRDAMADMFGWESESTSQSSTSKGFQAMSQDTGEELNGRFTALQIAGEEIKTQNIAQTQSLNLLTARADAILSMNTETRNIADDTRNLIAQSYLELVQISENTGNSAKYLKDIKADIAEVKKNTSKL